MKTRISISKSSSPQSFSIKALVAAIAASGILSYEVNAAPTGGAVVGGTGSINQIGSTTQVQQTSNRLAVQWNSFNVAASESVKFVQPNKSAIALNRILDNNASQILGKIDANGHVILMNPNGILFGTSAQVNVGGLIASGLNIKTSDFMSGDLNFSEVAGTTGLVVNRGLINAASGGNVALLGKSVANHGLISAELGHVVLAAGSEVVVTFDDDGLIGVRIDQETLASDVSGNYAVNNTGKVEAKGGKILLNASVSADLFSEAVNHGGLNGSTDVIVHDDGSFTLGAGNNVINTGTLDVSTGAASASDAGYVVLAGENIEQRGTILANASGENLAGQVYIEAYNQARMNNAGRIEANSDVVGGTVSIAADYVSSTAGASIATTGNTYINGYLNARLPTLDTHHLYVSGFGTVNQAGAATVTGNTHVTTSSGGNIRLNNSDNDFNTVSIKTYYNDNVVIVDSNDIILGDISMEDSSLRVDALGEDATISQAENSNLYLSAGNLRLTADNVILGENGSTTDLSGVSFYAEFGKKIATNGSISLLPYNGFDANTARVVGKDDGVVVVDLRGDKEIEFNGDLETDQFALTIHRMIGRTATLSSSWTNTYQTGPITLSGALTWNSRSAELTNPENDIAAIQGTGAGAFSSLRYVDKNDLVIRKLVTGEEVFVGLSSVGEGATLRQAANSEFQAEFVELSAENIILGSNGRSSFDAGYSLSVDFSGRFELNGPWMLKDYANQGPTFIIRGTDGPNQLIFGKHAVNYNYSDGGVSAKLDIDLMGGDDLAVFDSALPLVISDPIWQTFQLNMGSGNDAVIFNHDVDLPVILGLGMDTVTIKNNSIVYDMLDFNSSEDNLLVTNP